MKTVFSFIFAIAITTFAVNPIGNYQNTPPYVPGGATTTLTPGTQILVCTGNCVNATDSKRAQVSVLRSYLNTANNDTTGFFIDTLGGLTAVLTDTVFFTKTDSNVCLEVKGRNGTSNADSLTLGHIPVFLRPRHDPTVLVYAVIDSGVQAALGSAYIDPSSGVIYYGVAKTTTGNRIKTTNTFVATGGKGFGEHPICYTKR